MSFNRYFHDELTALRELGKEFSVSNPRLAPFLAEEARDPDVERLLEGVAFMTGRLRQKLDDELPELTHSLMALLWPSFLRPLPSMSILQFSPLIPLGESQRISRGTEIDSVPVDGTVCRFRTCYDVDLHPLEIDHLEKQDRPNGATLKLVLGATTSGDPDSLTLSSLRFFLHGENHVVQALYLWMFRYLSRLRVRITGQNGSRSVLRELTTDSVKPGGMSGAESLLPIDEHGFEGYRLLQEYFAFPEKFHFVDITGLDDVISEVRRGDESFPVQEIALEFEFDRAFESHVHVATDNFRMNCTPIVNLFTHDAIPIRLDHRKTEYRLLPQGDSPQHYEVFSVDRVEGWGHTNRHYKEFQRFESFRHAQAISASDGGRYYRERIKESVSGAGVERYLSFVDGNEHGVIPETESVSIDLTCSNRHLPTALSVGDININTGTSPEYASFENITAVTPAITPPLDRGFHWRLISNMSLNYVSLSDLETLRAVIASFDYRCFHDRQQARASEYRLKGIEAIVSEPVERLFRGAPLRGTKTSITVKESAFANDGDLYLFMNVLNEFFAMYASINSFHQLEVSGRDQGEVYRWRPRLGRKTLI